MTAQLSHSVLAHAQLPYVLRLSALSPLRSVELLALSELQHRSERHLAGEMLLPEGGSAGRARFILSGWACRQRTLPDGRRQILSFMLPGDGIGTSQHVSPLASAETVALTRVETVDAQRLTGSISGLGMTGISRALAAAQAADEGLLLDHIVRLGHQTAYERTAHLLLEFARRLAVVRHSDGRSFRLPISQEVLADALGISVVHVNRTLSQIRRDRLIEVSGSEVRLLQPEALALIADYAPERY